MDKKRRKKSFVLLSFQFSFCFWMKTDDLANYGTVLSYATETEDNELTFTDYGGFVLSVKGKLKREIKIEEKVYFLRAHFFNFFQGKKS